MPRFSTIDNASLYYRDIGKGPSIIMLHGFGMHSGHWLPYAWALSRKYRVIIPDLRGFGRSHHVDFSEQCAVSNFASDIDQLIDHLQLGEFKLIGISMGALTSLKLIETHRPEKLQRYLHIDQSPCCVNKSDWEWGLFGDEHNDRLETAALLLEDLAPFMARKAPYQDIPLALRWQIHQELSEFFASALSNPIQKALSRTLISKEWVSQKILPTENWSAYMHCLNSYITERYDLRSAVASSSVPIDILVGMKSDMYPATGQLRMADLNSNCSVIPFTRSGHAPLIDQPIKLSKELFRFAAS
jgi:non-heme chloroperoxidase